MASPRRFDHEQAVKRWQQGETFVEIARDLGVTPRAVEQAVKKISDPAYAQRQRDYHREYQRRTQQGQGVCVDCGAPIWVRKGAEAKLEHRCRACDAKRKTTSVRPDSLHCSECGEWKADKEFPRADKLVRRFRHHICRPCQTLVRKRYRIRLAPPCTRCGGPTKTPVSEHRPGSEGLCRACYVDSIRRVG